MPDSIRVPDIPGPRKQLCWQQDPTTMARCDRRQHGPEVRHTWEMATELAALRQRVSKYEEDEAAICPEDVGFVELITVLRKQLTVRHQRHAEAVEAAYKEALETATCILILQDDEAIYSFGSCQDAWLASEAKAALEGDHD